MTDALRGMVLAAGYGTRLAPLTDHVPKPLLPIDGTTLLERAVGILAGAGCTAVGVNTHHLGGMIARQLEVADLPVPVSVFPETEILGTGGALAGAREFLGGAENFLLHNGDVLWDGDAAALVQQHGRTGAVATLLLTDWPAVNTVFMADDDRILSLRGNGGEGRRLTYTGIGVFSHRILDDIGPGFSSLVDPLERALAAHPGSVRAMVQDGTHWSDLGTLGRYLRALADSDETSGPLRVDPFAGHGSERRFWRLGVGGWSAVAMLDAPDSDEFTRQIVMNKVLAREGLGTAAILAVDEDETALLMEDLGSMDLWTRVQNIPADPKTWVQIYAPVVDHLLGLQKAGQNILAQVPEAGDRVLDYAGLRWETGYFQEHFLQGYLGWTSSDYAGLDAEFQALATVVAAQPEVLIHRDFQSRNIMLTEGEVRLVDVQGARRGPLFYDLASLLWDPYVRIPAAARSVLVDRFASGISGAGLTGTRATAMFHAAALQRLMQALGAFAFLGGVKGKTAFLAHIPRALANLQQVLNESSLPGSDTAETIPGLLPRLTTLVERAADKCGHEVTDD